MMETTTEFERQSGLILWLPKGTDMSKIKKNLSEEMEIVMNTKIADKNKILALLQVAKGIIHAYPNRKLRFYIDKNCGCPYNVNMDWKTLSDKEQMFIFRYNGTEAEKKEGKP
jgi:hypothetical protein